ncbi:MAG: hypothetical protein ABRQ37_06725, partial [Candidatus Eremiobacterota bacterium]
QFNIKGYFGEGDRGYIDAFILKNNKIVFSKLNMSRDKEFDLTITVNEGDNIDFEAGKSYDGYGYDNTLIEAKIIKK